MGATYPFLRRSALRTKSLHPEHTLAGDRAGIQAGRWDGT